MICYRVHGCMPTTDTVTRGLLYIRAADVVMVVSVCSDDDRQTTESSLTMQQHHVAWSRVQPRLNGLAHVTQPLQRRSQCVRPTKVQHL